MSRWIRCFSAPMDVPPAFDSIRNLDELTGFRTDRDGYALCDYGLLIRLDDLERLDAVLAALIKSPDKSQ